MSKSIVTYYNVEDQVNSKWTPADDLTNFIAWYDAADSSTITESSGSVSQWDDKSGNSRHATQGTGSNQPLYSASDSKLNGLPTIGTNAQKRYLDTPSFLARRIYLVTYYDDPDDTFDSFRTLISDPDNDPRWQGQSTSNHFQTGAIVGISTVYRNGVALTTNQSVLPMGPTQFMCEWDADYTNVWRILAGLQSYHYWEYGALGEVIFTDGTETTAKRQRLEGYLAWKWGLVSNLPSEHPYKSAPPL